MNLSDTREYKNNYQKEWRKRNPDKRKEYKKKWHENNPGANSLMGWRRRLFRVYNITPEDYEAMFQVQKGLCAICKNPEIHRNKFGEVTRLSVDHNHKTAKIRKLLCSRCNILLGQCNEDMELLYKAIQYLEAHQ